MKLQFDLIVKDLIRITAKTTNPIELVSSISNLILDLRLGFIDTISSVSNALLVQASSFLNSRR